MSIFEKIIFATLIFFTHGLAIAQWAVSDKDVYDQLILINSISGRNLNIDDSFKHSRSAEGNITLGSGGAQTTYKSPDTKFEDLVIPPAEAEKYIITSQDCGSKEANEKHYKACSGLRNLKITTVRQSYDMLKTMDKRRAQIYQLIKDAGNLRSGGGGPGSSGDGAGVLQRYQFDLQALQALTQTDSMQLKLLMDSYKQREELYKAQMIEAKRASDTGAFDSGKSIPRKKTVPFVMP